MEQFFENVRLRMEHDLAANESEPNPLKRICLNRDRIRSAISELFENADFNLAYSCDMETCIIFNKRYFPPLLAKLVYLHFCFEFERHKRYSTKEKHRVFCEDQLGIVDQFFSNNREFYEYYHSGKNKGDELYFWLANILDSNSVLAGIVDPPPIIHKIVRLPFVNIGLLQATAIIAYDQYAVLLKEELQGPEEVLAKTLKGLTIEVDATETDFIQLIRAFVSAKLFKVDGTPATFKFLIECARKITNLPLKNYEKLDRNARERKKESILQRLARSLEAWETDLLLKS